MYIVLGRDSVLEERHAEVLAVHERNQLYTRPLPRWMCCWRFLDTRALGMQSALWDMSSLVEH